MLVLAGLEPVEVVYLAIILGSIQGVDVRCYTLEAGCISWLSGVLTFHLRLIVSLFMFLGVIVLLLILLIWLEVLGEVLLNVLLFLIAAVRIFIFVVQAQFANSKTNTAKLDYVSMVNIHPVVFFQIVLVLLVPDNKPSHLYMVLVGVVFN